VRLYSQRSAGANWVADQLLAWDLRRAPATAVGLLDDDAAGRDAKVRFDREKRQNNARVKARTLITGPTLGRVRGKMPFPIEIEDLLGDDARTHAQNQGWFRTRTDLIEWSGYKDVNKSMKQHCLDKGLTSAELSHVLHEIGTEHKGELAKWVSQNGDLDFSHFIELVKELEAMFPA
jgi:hypothetical protein